MPSLKVGDTARLKSGGPLMTVESIRSDLGDDASILCVWFVKEEIKNGWFSPAALQPGDGVPVIG